MNLRENIERIKSIMGIYEQQSQGRCDQWKNGTFVNGDGITTPKITITKTPTLIEGLYEGPDAGGCIQRSKFNDKDTPHQLAGITVFYEAAPYLKELYKNGTYVKPDMKNITMERNPNEMFKISIPLIPTTEDKAITSINERGGMGHEGNLTEITNIENDPNNILQEKVKIKAGDITETFICFRNKINFPIKTVTPKTTTGQQPKNVSEKIINIDVTTDAVIEPLNDLSKKFKEESDNKISANNNQLYYFDEENSPGFTINSDNSINYKITLKNTGTPGYGFKKYRLLFGRESLENVKTENPGSLVLNFGTVTSYGNEYEYFLVGIKF